MLHPAIELRDSGIAGSGLFVTAPIAAGAVVWSTTLKELEPFYNRQDIAMWSAQKQQDFFALAYQIGPDLWSGPLEAASDDPADCMNHSCDPSSWFVDDLTMVARRDLNIGDEVTYDYATSQTDPTYGFPCCCGAANCRGAMNGADWASNPQLAKQYGPHAMTHVLADTR